MPYIKQELREYLDSNIEALILQMRDSNSLDGEVNYVISRIVSGSFMPGKRVSYLALSKAITALECAKLELYRRIGSEKEDDMIKINGDIKEYV